MTSHSKTTPQDAQRFQSHDQQDQIHQDSSEGVWTPANKVTLLRILLIPVFVVVIVSPWPQWLTIWPEAGYFKSWVAAAVFILISLTDSIDGYLARSRNEVTTLGKFMDPLADKILVAAALLALIELGALPSWPALVILAREFIVSGIRMVAASRGSVIAASWYGKAKTFVQIIAIVLFIIKGFSPLHSNVPFYVISWLVMLVAVVLTIVSMMDYLVKASDLLGFSRKQRITSEPFETSCENNFNQIIPSEYEETISERSRALIDKLSSSHLTIGTAESCTGGLIAGCLTAQPGSSAVVKGSVVSYANEVKERSLGVSDECLSAYGAVSSQVAKQMAQGARCALVVDIAVSVTGIAGPSGATPDKPVGTVWFGIEGNSMCSTECKHFSGNRSEIRAQAVIYAMDMISRCIDNQQRDR